MDNLAKILREAYEAVEDGRVEDVEAFLHEDFEFVHPSMDGPVDRATFLKMVEEIPVAFPDWQYHLHDVVQDGETVRSKVKITGTNTGELDLSFMGGPVLPATGRSFELPEESGTETFRDGKLIREVVDELPEGQVGGMTAIFQQLGVDLDLEA